MIRLLPAALLALICSPLSVTAQECTGAFGAPIPCPDVDEGKLAYFPPRHLELADPVPIPATKPGTTVLPRRKPSQDGVPIPTLKPQLPVPMVVTAQDAAALKDDNFWVLFRKHYAQLFSEEFLDGEEFGGPTRVQVYIRLMQSKA
ncbi:hypothetical protein [Poseidonocella sedimentorum]|uniref:hypothetical protein n=1 Tax=Poseidonocella sedimentorum TaxID=871652 RepID=UPI001160DE4A|nr:hypothetical protein [Poseidonocella sedimentorum]